MANYAIMRCEKIKSRASLTRALQHNTRVRIPRNAKTDIKERVITLYSNDMANYKDCFKKARKNAVYGVEWLFTASDMSNIDLKQWGKDNLEWVAKEMGKENILNASIHLDETTPHMHILVVPRYNDKLNCKHYLGGTKYKMRELQDNYFERVGLNYNLTRGQDKVKTNTYHEKHDLSKLNNEIEKKEEKLKNLNSKLEIFEKKIENYNEIEIKKPKTEKILFSDKVKIDPNELNNNILEQQRLINAFFNKKQKELKEEKEKLNYLENKANDKLEIAEKTENGKLYFLEKDKNQKLENKLNDVISEKNVLSKKCDVLEFNVSLKIDEATKPLKKEIGELKDYKKWINGLISNLEKYVIKHFDLTQEQCDKIEKHGTLKNLTRGMSL